MEFNEKLQQLRKSRGLTQDDLANAIFVSRAAISKWESGRGYPSIDSLKAISRFFSISIDDLLSGNELLSIAEKDHEFQELKHRDLQYGLFDISAVTLFFLPIFRASGSNEILSVPLLSLSGINNYLLFSFFFLISLTILCGILTLTMQNYDLSIWTKSKTKVSFALNIATVLLFIASMQPYAAALSLVFLSLKIIMIRK